MINGCEFRYMQKMRKYCFLADSSFKNVFPISYILKLLVLGHKLHLKAENYI